MNQTVHMIDQFQWFMGPCVEVVGRIATLRHGDYIDVEDTAVATLVFENGGLAHDHRRLDLRPPVRLPGRDPWLQWRHRLRR